MKAKRQRSEEIQAFIVNRVTNTSVGLSSAVMGKFDMTKQAASLHIKQLCDDGVIVGYKRGRRKTYHLTRNVLFQKRYINSDIAEDRIWTNSVKPHILDLPENIRFILQYGFTEMLNNAIDHSESDYVNIGLARSSVDTHITISDDGEGIFKRIQRLKGFPNERYSIFELAKGKLTTDPDNHSGEGIFFTSRMFDKFSIMSDQLFFNHSGDQDWLLEGEAHKGTFVGMQISNDSLTEAEEVFDNFSDPDSDPSFNKTVVPVRLADYAEDGLVSRSQAKRILTRFDRFKSVVLDFSSVKRVGQGFADEIFRVFRNAHPEIKITHINAVKSVEKMITRAENSNAD